MEKIISFSLKIRSILYKLVAKIIDNFKGETLNCFDYQDTNIFT